MLLHKEYVWLEPYITAPEFWSEDVLPWDVSFGLASNDYNIFTILTSPFAIRTYVFIESITKMSFLDFMLIAETSELLEIQKFYTVVIWDLYEILQNLHYSTPYIFYTSSQDLCLAALHNSPEIMFALTEFVTTYFSSNTYKYAVAVFTSIFTDSFILKMSWIIYTIALFVGLVWFYVIVVNVSRLVKWTNIVESHSTRLSLYMNSISKENRLQFEAVLLTVSLFTFLNFYNIFNIKDLYEESMENIMLSFFYIFLTIFAFFFFKNSIHYFAFLEASMSNNQTTGVYMQFGKDAANTFVLSLRFTALMVRINIYDTVEDLLDSNYIFACEFVDEPFDDGFFFAWFNYSLTELSIMWSRIELKPYGVTVTWDSLSMYLQICGMILGTIFAILEAAGRALLGFFIVYLIIFEMQSINRSYTEDSFFANEKNNK